MQDLTEIWLRDHDGVEIQILKPDTAYWVKVPELNFAQMFLNLLDNAYEASDNTVITVEIQEGANALLVQVRNSGSQFDKDVLERFGEPFVTTKSTGTGLGLYTAHLFMQSLGGSVKLSNANQGAVVGAIVELHFPASLKNQEATL
ncbi:Sporulation kinase A [compost metagenome]